MSDNNLLAGTPDYLTFGSMLKATPHEESGERFIYFEASNEKLDQQNERVLAKALEESAAHFLKFGNLDIDHYTLIGRPNPAKGFPGIPNYQSYEIGRPVDVKLNGTRTFVKAQLYKGDSSLAENANMVWDSMTKISPAAHWFPSVGGQVLSKTQKFDAETKQKIEVVDKVRWTNIALSRTPVNQNLPTAQTVPMDVLAKCWSGSLLDFTKSLTAGYGSDSAALTGGSALRIQSLEHRPASYLQFREKLAGDMRAGKVRNPDALKLVNYCKETFGLTLDESAEWVERFMRNLKTGLNKRSKT